MEAVWKVRAGFFPPGWVKVRKSIAFALSEARQFTPEKCKVMPELSARQNIVVIAAEAPRSRHG